MDKNQNPLNSNRNLIQSLPKQQKPEIIENFKTPR